MDEQEAAVLAELAEDDLPTCDWGYCHEDAVAVRWDEEHGFWLSVCALHTSGAPVLERH